MGGRGVTCWVVRAGRSARGEPVSREIRRPRPRLGDTGDVRGGRGGLVRGGLAACIGGRPQQLVGAYLHFALEDALDPQAAQIAFGIAVFIRRRDPLLIRPTHEQRRAVLRCPNPVPGGPPAWDRAPPKRRSATTFHN